MYLTQGLHRAMQQKPDSVATIYRGRRRTFREFGERVARLAAALRGLGVAAGDRVGLLALNSDRYLEAMMAVWWAGGVLCPINVRWSVSEIVYSLDDCDTGVLIVDDRFTDLAECIRATARRPPVFVHASDKESPAGMFALEHLVNTHAPVEDAGRGGHDLACIMYTGGTTGFPKGVMQSHLNLWSSCIQRMAQTPPGRDSVLLHVAPLFHAAAVARALIQFIAGEAHVVVPGFDVVEVLETIERERITETILVPTMAHALLAHSDLAKYDLGSLQRLTYGASPSAAAMVEQMAVKFAGVELSHSYGLTEACPLVSTNPPENHDEAARASGLSRSVGRSLPGVDVRIVDDQGKELPRGTVGEIVVRGLNVMQGYWNKPEETAQALRAGWLHTGDGAYMDKDGYIFVVDRLKDMIVTGGENVYSIEVENVIARHADVAMCAVIGIPDDRWGEAVHAVVVLKPDAKLDEAALRAHCRTTLAGYKCPRTIEFCDELPTSAAGKVLKRDLRASHQAGRGTGVR